MCSYCRIELHFDWTAAGTKQMSHWFGVGLLIPLVTCWNRWLWISWAPSAVLALRLEDSWPFFCHSHEIDVPLLISESFSSFGPNVLLVTWITVDQWRHFMLINSVTRQVISTVQCQHLGSFRAFLLHFWL